MKPTLIAWIGAGYIRKIGAKVGTSANSSTAPLREGDPVLLSYAFCNDCSSCLGGHPAYCLSALGLNFGDSGGAYRRHANAGGDKGVSVAGGFFGQSSLASLAVVRECCIISVAGIVKDKEELKLFAPLGCGFQTGAATVSVLAGAQPSDSVAIVGLGGVGLAGIMASYVYGWFPDVY